MMDKISDYFKRMDKMVFEQFDLLKNSSIYEDLWDKLDSLSGGQGKFVAQVLSVIIVLFPLLVALIVWWGNSDLKETLATKRQIEQTVYKYKSKKTVITPLKLAGSSRSSLKSKEDFIRILNISPDKEKDVKIEKIALKKISKDMGRSRVILSFQDLTTNSLMEMIKNLAYQHKAKVSNIKIKKDKILKTLKGEVELLFYSAVKLKNGKQKK